MLKLAKTRSIMNQKLVLSWRIGLMQWETDESFDRLLALLDEHRSVVDEVALFDSITHHLYIPLLLGVAGDRAVGTQDFVAGRSLG